MFLFPLRLLFLLCEIYILYKEKHKDLHRADFSCLKRKTVAKLKARKILRTMLKFILFDHFVLSNFFLQK